MTEQIIFLGLVVFASHMVEGITGFGCMILALPFAAGPADGGAGAGGAFHLL